ncbi:MAG: glutaredoxin [Gammaproteobacteria bacterium]|nr:glutaredoxin [Gammaproteobacteria bacterium]
MLLKMLRNGLGSIVVFIDWITRPSKLERTPEQQLLVEKQLKDMTLYQLYACPFCIKTRRALRRLNLPMEIRSVSVGSPYREELQAGGGQVQVPCLRLQQDGKDVWMYESADIINYLEQRFG